MPNKRISSMMRFRWLIFLILSMAYFFVYFHRLSLSVVANDLMKDFETTASMMGIIGSVYFYIYAAMQLPAGLLADSLGPRKSVTSFLLIASFGSIIFGLSKGVGMAFFGRIMVGLGVSLVFIPTMKILSQWFRAREFAMMAGILNAVGGIGVLAATWLLALMSARLGWRISFEIIGACTIVIVGLIWLVVRDRPEDRGWPSIAELERIGETTAATPRAIPIWEGVKHVFSEKYFWPVAIWFFFDGGVFLGFGGLWGGPYLIHVYGMKKAEAGAVLSMIAWGMIVGSPFLGLISDKLVKSRKKLFIACSSVLSLELLFLYIFPSGLPLPLLYAVFFLFSVCSASIVIMAFTTIKELFPVEIAGTSVGTVNLFPFLGGAIYMPLLGKVLDIYPKSPAGDYSLEAYSYILFILFGSSVVSLAATFFMKETFKG